MAGASLSTWLNFLTVAACLSIMVGAACRMSLLTYRVHRVTVAVQFFLLGMGALGSMLLKAAGSAFDLLPLAAGVAAFLALSSRRWRDAPPPGTELQRRDEEEGSAT